MKKIENHVMFVNVVPSKGVDRYTVRKVTRIMTTRRYWCIIFKTDGEVSVMVLRNEVVKTVEAKENLPGESKDFSGP